MSWLSIAKQLAGPAAVLLISWAIFTAGYRSGHAAVSADWEADKLVRMNNLLAQEARHRAQERKWHGRVRKLSDRLAQAQRDSLTELDTTLADLRGDNLRLRQRFRACESRVLGPAGTSSGDDGAGTGGLSEQDQETILRIGADADRVAHKLAACQDFVAGITNAARTLDE